jgi:GrpB-like predicted nucleotidyltransferase (UPF0157 family)/pimeloyl-ACP methyl ester carboxylesterase
METPMQDALFADAATSPLGNVEAGPPDGLPAPTVVALHGGLVGGRLTFGPVLPAWSRRLRVVVPDRRGFERTQEPAGGTIAEQAGDLLGVIDARAAGRAHVVAASFGGVIALTALQQRPSAFRSLVLLEAPAMSLVADDDEVTRWQAELQRTWERIDDAPEPILRRFIARTDPGSLDGMLRLLAAGDPGLTPIRDELRPWRTPLAPEPLLAALATTPVPVLVASGARSVPIFRRIGDRVAALLGAEHLLVEGAGHAVHLAGRRLLHPLQRFIARAEATATAAEPVRLVAPDPAWPAAFAAERDAIAGALGHRLIAVEHIGSTAVPGLRAKPVVDVLVGIDDLAGADDVVARLEAIGYAAWGEDPAPDRRFLLRAADGVRRFHVHVAARGSAFWRDHVAFRDALRADAALRDRYAARKAELAAAHRDDREAYTSGKGDFVAAALRG